MLSDVYMLPSKEGFDLDILYQLLAQIKANKTEDIEISTFFDTLYYDFNSPKSNMDIDYDADYDLFGEYIDSILEDNISIDNLMNLVIDIVKPTQLVSNNVIDDEHFKSLVYLDILIPVMVYLREKTRTKPMKFIDIIEKYDEYGTNYENYYRNLRGFSIITSELFNISYNKGEYNIRTEYPALIMILVNKLGVSPISDKESTRISYKKNKAFLNFYLDFLKDKSSEIYLESYYIFERLFSLHSRFYYLKKFINNNHGKDITDNVVDSIIKNPIVFSKYNFYDILLDNINVINVEEFMDWISDISFNIIPKCQLLLYHYIRKQVPKSENYKDYLDKIYESETFISHYSKHVSRIENMMEEHDISERGRVKYVELAKKWDVKVIRHYEFEKYEEYVSEYREFYNLEEWRKRETLPE